MMTIVLRTLPLAVLAVAATAVPASAQEVVQEMVPLELVRALPLGPRDGELANVMVGRLTDELAGMLTLPQDARIIGSFVVPRMTLSVVALPEAPSMVRSTFPQRLRNAGWRPFDAIGDNSGFLSNVYPRFHFCRGDSAMLTFSIVENPHGGSYVRLLYPTARERSVCAQDQLDSRSGESLIPLLLPPAGSRTVRIGGGGTGDRWTAEARISADLSPIELVEHYGVQLREHGWSVRGRAAAADVAVETYAVPHDEGGAWHGVLIASAPEENGLRFMSLTVTRIGPDTEPDQD